MRSIARQHHDSALHRALRPIVRCVCGLVMLSALALTEAQTSRPSASEIAAVAPTPAPTSRPAEPASRDRITPARSRPSWESYDVVVRRNVFSTSPADASTAARSSTTQPTAATQPVPRTGLAAWVLTGIVTHGGTSVAFIENTATGTTVRVKAGESVASLRVVHIESQRVELDADGAPRMVAIGSSLDGTEHLGTLASPATSSPSANSSDGASPVNRPAPSAAEMSTIEKLKARRAKELAK
jgi:hypothetical protein